MGRIGFCHGQFPRRAQTAISDGRLQQRCGRERSDRSRNGLLRTLLRRVHLVPVALDQRGQIPRAAENRVAIIIHPLLPRIIIHHPHNAKGPGQVREARIFHFGDLLQIYELSRREAQVRHAGQELVLNVGQEPGEAVEGRNEVPDTLDAQMIRDAQPLFTHREKMQLQYSVRNTHRAVGTRRVYEIDRELQPLLIQECARALHPGGHFILFEDAPGPTDDEPMDGRPLAEVIRDVNVLRCAGIGESEGVLVAADSEPAMVRDALDRYEFDGTATGKIGFANAWIMVKDWVNLNRHEVAHRYFASVAEICEWAKAHFGAPREVNFNHYRLNPLIFNEMGIQRVLDHLEREVPPGGDRANVVERDESQLAEWIWESERLRVLVDFTRNQLPQGTPLATALDAKEESISLNTIDPALALLDRPNNTAPSFNLPCAVLVFEKDPARTS